MVKTVMRKILLYLGLVDDNNWTVGKGGYPGPDFSDEDVVLPPGIGRRESESLSHSVDQQMPPEPER